MASKLEYNYKFIFWTGLFLAVAFFAGFFLGRAFFKPVFEENTLQASAIGVSGTEVKIVPLTVTSKLVSAHESVFVDLRGPEFFDKTFQASAVNAYTAARMLMPQEFKGKSFLVSSTAYEELNGASGSVLLGVSFLALASNSKIKDGVFATGDLSANGNIGRVVYVGEKALFLRDLGAETLIVADDDPNFLNDDTGFFTGVSDLRSAACLMLEGPALERLNC